MTTMEGTMETQEATETVMCAAVPNASTRPGRNRRTCASTANAAVEHVGVSMPVCKMHERSWERAADQAALAEAWGW